MLNTFVTSTNIDRVGYKYGKLFIQFKSGIVYQYDAVDKAMYDALIIAESAGKFFHQFIRSVYTYTKLPNNPFDKQTPA